MVVGASLVLHVPVLRWFALVLCKVHFHYTWNDFGLATSQSRDVQN